MASFIKGLIVLKQENHQVNYYCVAPGR